MNTEGLEDDTITNFWCRDCHSGTNEPSLSGLSSEKALPGSGCNQVSRRITQPIFMLIVTDDNGHMEEADEIFPSIFGAVP